MKIVKTQTLLRCCTVRAQKFLKLKSIMNISHRLNRLTNHKKSLAKILIFMVVKMIQLINLVEVNLCKPRVLMLPNFWFKNPFSLLVWILMLETQVFLHNLINSKICTLILKFVKQKKLTLMTVLISQNELGLWIRELL